ncbi:MAG TPA: hypothetical protein VLA06_05540 [Woeseiaceae bacterium]|jgi:hypothetical protein|nr:hypothetical protein [Woeseiaceae bacterium]
MAEPALESTQFHLPVRIRSRRASADDLNIRLALAEHLSELPELTTVEAADATVPWSVDMYLQIRAPSPRERQPAPLFCRINHNGIGVHGLIDRDRYQVLVRGWGRLARDSVILYMPRDVGELDVCWEILQRAYRSLIQSSAQDSPMRRSAWSDKLPRFSRTTLQ